MATNSDLTRDLTNAGFAVPEESEYRRLILSTCAKEKCGKTDFALRATPQPVYAVATDTGTDEVARKLRNQLGRRIYVSTIKPPSKNAVGSVEESKKLYTKVWDQVVTAIKTVVDTASARTLVVDTATEVHEMLRLARLGKLTQVMPHHYGPVNREMTELVKYCLSREDLVVIFIHKMKKEYKANKKGEDSWTGRYERAGFGDMPYLVDVNLEHYFIRERDEETVNEFGVRVIDCRQNHLVSGMEIEGDMCNFSTLAEMIFPGTEGEWD